MATAIVEVRAQKSRGQGAGKHGGPNRYVAVQVVPEGVEPLTSLRLDIAAKRGIEIVRFGEGYSEHAGPRSALGQALAAASAYAATINAS